MKKISLLAIVLLMSVSISGFSADKEKGSKTKQEYIADLSSTDENVVVSALDKLGQDKVVEGIPEISRLLSTSENINIRAQAAVSLGYIKNENGVDALNEALIKDASADVRYAAILSISRIGSKKSYSALKEAREKETDPIILDYMKKMEEKLKGK